ncbi:MAG: hypothetical protein JNL79_18700 [Myxococcales bacterium]|nr:hypothetical protein [Myxococcales bacterium]
MGRTVLRIGSVLALLSGLSGCAEDAASDVGTGTDAATDAVGDTGTLGDTGALGDTGSVGDVGGDTSVDAVVVDTAIADTAIADTGTADTGIADTKIADTGITDAGPGDTGLGDTGLVDTGAWSPTAHVHIYISNTCGVTTDPVSFDVPAGKTVKVSWHNHSLYYRADVWASYGGGYLALEKGATWNETYEHCFIKSTHTEWVDVTPEGSPSPCGKQRVYFYCHA